MRWCRGHTDHHFGGSHPTRSHHCSRGKSHLKGGDRDHRAGRGSYQYNLNFCPDTAHIDAAGGSSAEVVRKSAGRIRHIHLKDYRDGNFLPLGEGTIDFQAILNTLHEHNYNGWITVEQDGYAGAATEGAIRSREYLERRLAQYG